MALALSLCFTIIANPASIPTRFLSRSRNCLARCTPPASGDAMMVFSLFKSRFAKCGSATTEPSRLSHGVLGEKNP